MMNMIYHESMVKKGPQIQRVARYQGPTDIRSADLRTLVSETGRVAPSDRQLDLLRGGTAAEGPPALVHYAGDLSLLMRRCVSIVGTRDVSPEGSARASRLARELADAGIVVVSGLAKGVDTVALERAILHGGRVAAVIGTPLAKAYPIENARLQERIWSEHLLISPFGEDDAVFRSNFPKRNRVMAALSDATVIVEASDTSGTLHQAAECQRLGRWLFIMKSVIEDQTLTWPASFLGKPKTAILSHADDVIQAIVTA